MTSTRDNGIVNHKQSFCGPTVEIAGDSAPGSHGVRLVDHSGEAAKAGLKMRPTVADSAAPKPASP